MKISRSVWFIYRKSEWKSFFSQKCLKNTSFKPKFNQEFGTAITRFQQKINFAISSWTDIHEETTRWFESFDDGNRQTDRWTIQNDDADQIEID